MHLSSLNLHLQSIILDTDVRYSFKRSFRMPSPPFGTASAYTDSFPAPPPARVTIAAETCFNLSAFKGESPFVAWSRCVLETSSFLAGTNWRHRFSNRSSESLAKRADMVRQYRKLDDQIITRLNRASAQLRDQDRLGGVGSGSSRSYSSSSSITDPAARDGIEGICTKMWSEMMCESFGLREDMRKVPSGSIGNNRKAVLAPRQPLRLSLALVRTKLIDLAGWTHRQTLLTFCLTTVHQSMESKKLEMSGQDSKLAAPIRSSNDVDRRVRGLKEEEVFVSIVSTFRSIQC